MSVKPGAVLITGGAGFVGSHVARRLAASRTVYVLDDLSTGDHANLPPQVAFQLGDIRSETDVRRAVANDIEVLVHCAAQTSVARSMANPEDDWEINVAGTHQVARLARQYGVKRFIYFSSGGALYGETKRAAGDSTMPRPASHYGLNKYAGEQIVRLEAPSYAILRPSNIYGPGQRADQEGGVVAIFIERLLAGRTIDLHGDGRQRRDFVYVDDVVDAVELAIEWPNDVIWNVASGRSVSIVELLATLQATAEREALVRRIPARLGDVGISQLSPLRLLDTGRWGPPLDLTAGLRRLLDQIATSSDLVMTTGSTPVSP